MKDKLTQKEIIYFILFALVGVILTILSFIFYYKNSSLSLLALILIDSIDGIYLIINIYIFLRFLKIKKIGINTFLTSLLYLAMFSTLGTLIFVNSSVQINLSFIQNIFQISLFLGPCFIILIPIFSLICAILG